MALPQTRWGAYSAPQSLVGFEGPASKGEEGVGNVRAEGERGEEQRRRKSRVEGGEP